VAEMEETELETATQSEKEKPAYNRKAFKDMSIEGKLDYLTIKPFYIPNIIVEISTSEGAVVGMVNKVTNGKVLVSYADQLGTAEINSEEIVPIRMKMFSRFCKNRQSTQAAPLKGF